MDPELHDQLKHLLLARTKLLFESGDAAPASSSLRSHMGGNPYFEDGENWPVNGKTGQPLEFIFQLVNDGRLAFPFPCQVLQFFSDYHGDEVVFDESDPDLFLIKVYSEVVPASLIRLPRPAALPPPKYTAITFQSEQCLPDDDELDSISPTTQTLCEALARSIGGDTDWWDVYDAAVTELVGEPGLGSWVGGYAQWLQGARPKGEFFLEFDSVEPFMWGDSGLLYFFYSADQATLFSFEMQCC